MTTLFPRQGSSERHAAADRRLACGYVLAGGASTRLGQDKALVPLGGTPALAGVLGVLSQSGVREMIVVGEKKKYGRFGARCVKDKWPGEGPLGGIVTALLRSVADKHGYRWNLILSCDMPFLTKEWLSYLCQRAAATKADVVVPRSDRGLEPLCACWRTVAGKPLQAAFAEGIRKVTEAMKRVSMEVVDERDCARFDNRGRLFWNMNTPAEYEEARRILESEGR